MTPPSILAKRTARVAGEGMIAVTLEEFEPHGLPLSPIAESSVGPGGAVTSWRQRRSEASKRVLMAGRRIPRGRTPRGIASQATQAGQQATLMDVADRVAALEQEVQRLAGIIERMKQAVLL